MIVHISGTGEIHGRGSDPFKWVSGLSEEQRGAVREEAIRQRDLALGRPNNSEPSLVIIRDPMDKGPHRCGYKVVRYQAGRYIHREPTPGQLEVIREAIGNLGATV